MLQARSSLLSHLRILGLGGALGLSAFMLAPSAATAQPSPCGPTTTVQAGDTYFAISQRCDVSVQFLEEANPGVDPNNLQVGQTLDLTTETNARAAEPMPQDRHEVQAGDTIFSVAQAMGVTVDALLRANPDIDPDALRIGQIIMPPAFGAPGDPVDPGPETRISGILTPEGVECQALRGQDGQLYTLVGDLRGYDDGDVVQVVGEVQEISFCQQGTTIEIEEIRRTG